MSWFDSSFSFAKSALSQAQKSIDRVLDIKEEQKNIEPPTKTDVSHSTPSLIETPKPKQSPSQAKRQSSSKPKASPTSNKPTNTPANTHTTSNTFDSTWGLSDSVWGTPFSSPPSNQNEQSRQELQRSKDARHSKDSKTSSLTSPMGRNERQTKARSKAPSDHVTSTPIGEGGGANLEPGGGPTLTPVRGDHKIQVVDRTTSQSETDQHGDSDEHCVDTSEGLDVENVRLSEQLNAHSEDVPHSPTNSQGIDKESSSSPASDGKKAEVLSHDPLPSVLSDTVLPHDPHPSVQTDGWKSNEGSAETKVSEEKIQQEISSNKPIDTHSQADEPLVTDLLVAVSEDKTEVRETTIIPIKKVAHEQSSNTTQGGSGTEVSSPTIELADAKNSTNEVAKECARLSELLAARETKMMDMSRQLVALTEENQTLTSQLSEAQEAGQTDIESLKEEFTKRLGASNKKLQAISKERDSLRKQLEALQNEQSHHKKSQQDSLTKLLQEKEEQIAQLMEEGEKLSKQELQSNGTIKKLRQKERQNDQLLSSQKQHIEDLEGKVANLKELCKKREENENKYQESLGQLNTIAEQQAKELTAIKAEREGLTDKVRSLQTNLDNAYKELADLQKENAVSQTVAQEAAMTAQSSAREEVRGLLEQQKVEAQREKEAVLLQLDELRMSMTRAEQVSARKEDHLRQEISDLQERLQEAETRNQELTSTISQATKPLLRQIENIQAAHSTQASNWERVEASLTQRLVDLQAQLSQATEKERSAVEKEMTLQSKVTILETQASSLRQEKSQLLASEELVKAKLQTIEEEQQRESMKMEALRTSFQQTVEDLRKEKDMLERQLEYERVRSEAESKKARLEAQEKERLKAQLVNFTSLNRPPAVARQSSSSSVQSQSELLEHSLRTLSDSGNSTAAEMVDYHSNSIKGGSASVIEHLQSLLKQKEGELSANQTLVETLERSRSSLAEDLSSLSAENESLQTQVAELRPLREQLQTMQHKHEAMLQMYGEKAEEAEELKLDIIDMKAMYRQQIDELLSGKSEH